jgi:hypothetical protein
MLLHCAAKHLCGYLKDGPFCVNCNGPLHGGTCGHLISEMPTTIVIHRELLTPRGQEMMFAENINGSALICNYCIDLHSSSAVLMPPLQDQDQDTSSSAAARQDTSTAAARMPSLQDPNSSSFAPKRKSSETAKGAPKKPKDEDLYSHFTIVNLPDGK